MSGRWAVNRALGYVATVTPLCHSKTQLRTLELGSPESVQNEDLFKLKKEDVPAHVSAHFRLVFWMTSWQAERPCGVCLCFADLASR